MKSENSREKGIGAFVDRGGGGGIDRVEPEARAGTGIDSGELFSESVYAGVRTDERRVSFGYGDESEISYPAEHASFCSYSIGSGAAAAGGGS